MAVPKPDAMVSQDTDALTCKLSRNRKQTHIFANRINCLFHKTAYLVFNFKYTYVII